MRFVSTSQLADSFFQQDARLLEAQQFALDSGLDFPVKSDAIVKLMSLKAQGEEKYHLSLQRREIFQNKIKAQKQNLDDLHDKYRKFNELYKSYQAMIRKGK